MIIVDTTPPMSREEKILAYEDAGFSVKEAEAYVGVLEEQDENLTSLL